MSLLMPKSGTFDAAVAAAAILLLSAVAANSSPPINAPHMLIAPPTGQFLRAMAILQRKPKLKTKGMPRQSPRLPHATHLPASLTSRVNEQKSVAVHCRAGSGGY